MLPALYNHYQNKATVTANLVSSRREAIKWVREEADAIIAQLERQAAGMDRGMYRDDDVHCDHSIRSTLLMHSLTAFALSRRYSN